VAINPVETSPLSALSHNELRALVDAAAWYAKYHQRMIANETDDSSTLTTARREHFSDLHAGLWKLGVRMRGPDGL